MKTKTSTLSILLCSFILLATSCGSKNEPAAQVQPDPIQKEIITQIFAAGSSASGVSMVRSSKSIAGPTFFKAPASGTPSIPIPSTTTEGPNGGTITISGNLVVTNPSVDATNISMSLSEVFSSFGIIADTKTYTMSGTVQYLGSFAVSTNKMMGKFTANGTLIVVGDSYNKQMEVNLTETITVNVNSSTNTTNSTITVAGTIAGQTINYTVTQ